MRRIAYPLLARLRSVMQRSDPHRAGFWNHRLPDAFVALATLPDSHVERLRQRARPPATGC